MYRIDIVIDKQIRLMKVLYILHSTLTTGGATKAVMCLAHGLKEKGVSPVFFVPDKNGIYATMLEEGYEVYAFPFRMSIYPSHKSIRDFLLYLPRLMFMILLNAIALLRLRQLVIKVRPDIIHTNTSVLDIGRIVAKWTDIPHVQHVREYGDKDFSMEYFPTYNYAHRSMCDFNACNICITKGIRDYHGFTEKTNATVVYDGVYPQLSSMPGNFKKNYFLYAGRIEYGKGVDLLLKAYKEYTNKVENPIPLKIAGGVSDVAYYDGIKNYITENQLDSYVTMMGVIGNIERLMQEARALVIPSRSEGFGFCMPEAMFNGCLCIGHDKAGTKEQLENGLEYSGGNIALSYDTTEELTNRLIEVHGSDDEHWREMKKRAFNTVNNLYTQNHAVETVLEIYRMVISRKVDNSCNI